MVFRFIKKRGEDKSTVFTKRNLKIIFIQCFKTEGTLRDINVGIEVSKQPTLEPTSNNPRANSLFIFSTIWEIITRRVRARAPWYRCMYWKGVSRRIRPHGGRVEIIQSSIVLARNSTILVVRRTRSATFLSIDVIKCVADWWHKTIWNEGTTRSTYTPVHKYGERAKTCRTLEALDPKDS